MQLLLLLFVFFVALTTIDKYERTVCTSASMYFRHSENQKVESTKHRRETDGTKIRFIAKWAGVPYKDSNSYGKDVTVSFCPFTNHSVAALMRSVLEGKILPKKRMFQFN